MGCMAWPHVRFSTFNWIFVQFLIFSLFGIHSTNEKRPQIWFSGNQFSTLTTVVASCEHEYNENLRKTMNRIHSYRLGRQQRERWIWMWDVECTRKCKKSICEFNALDRHDFWLPIAVAIVAISLLNAQLTYSYHHRMETTSFPRKQFSFVYFNTKMKDVGWDWTQFFFSIIILFFCSL